MKCFVTIKIYKKNSREWMCTKEREIRDLCGKCNHFISFFYFVVFHTGCYQQGFYFIVE